MNIFGFEVKRLVKPKPVTEEQVQHLVLEGVQKALEQLKTTTDTTTALAVIETAKEAIPMAKPETVQSVAVPQQGGRSSMSEAEMGLYGLVMQNMKIKNEVPTEVYEALEYLSMWNNDFSYAVDNIQQLGNTPFTITYEDTVAEEQVKAMNSWLAARYDKWYANSTGIHSLINDLLSQAAVTGVISAEIVPQQNIFKGIQKAVIVSPKRVKFVYNKDKDEYLPYQEINRLNGGTVELENMIPLNPVTYKYIAMRRLSEKPYGIPPFLSCLEHIVVEKSILKNVKYIIEKFGVLGFLQVLITPPMHNGFTLLNTNDENLGILTQKATAMLDMAAGEIDRGLHDGFMMGFKGQHEIEMKSIDKDVAGAESIREMNRTDKMSGLKQDPVMFGRDSRTSEALARVLLEKMGKQVGNYQATVAAFLNALFQLELNLAGFPVKAVRVQFEKASITDKVKEATAMQIEILNANELYNNGVISQDVRAQMLGFEKPDQEEPRVDPTAAQNAIEEAGANATDGKGNKTKKQKAKEKLTLDELQEGIQEFGIKLLEDFTQYDYGTDSICGCGADHKHTHGMAYALADNDPRFDEMFNEYAAEIQKRYHIQLDKVGKDIVTRLKTYGRSLTLEIFTDVVFYTLYKNWTEEFAQRNLPNVRKHVRLAYKEFRKSTKAFDKLGRSGIPDATFGLRDARAIEYLTRNDDMYLGKFITDTDTKKRLTQFIRDKYLEGNTTIGNNPKALAAFRKEFGDFMQGEEWKINRIISTTLNKARNYGAVYYMEQAEVTTFEIRGVNDRLQCGYCSYMQGMKFNVTTAVEQMDKVTQGDPLQVKYDTPFVTAKFKTPADMKGQTGETLQALGIALPPFHPSCRDVVVAVL